jgi:hypothetical protein
MRPASNALPVSHSLTFAYVLSALVAVLLVISSVGGLLFGRQGLYDLNDPRALPAFQGQDAISLFVGLPLLLGSLWFVRRGSLRGLLIWMGTLFYVLYAHAYHVFGALFNPLFLVYLATASLSLYALLSLLVGVEPRAVAARFRAGLPTRFIGGSLVAIPLVFAILWVGIIISTLVGGEAVDPVLRLVSTLDLMMPLPAMFLGGILLWRRRPWGYVLSGLVLVMITFYGFTLVAITWLSILMGGPDDPFVVAYLVVGVGGLISAFVFFRAIGERDR